jgi:hypothetical protein
MNDHQRKNHDQQHGRLQMRPMMNLHSYDLLKAVAQ